MESGTRVQIQQEFVLFRYNNLGKGLVSYLPFGKSSIRRKEKRLFIQISCTLLKNWPCIPEVLGKVIYLLGWIEQEIDLFTVRAFSLTWGIISKVWLLVKRRIQEIWRCYSNDDVIVIHARQSEKHHKDFLEKCHEMNSKRKIQWPQVFSIFLK